MNVKIVIPKEKGDEHEKMLDKYIAYKGERIGKIVNMQYDKQYKDKYVLTIQITKKNYEKISKIIEPVIYKAIEND